MVSTQKIRIKLAQITILCLLLIPSFSAGYKTCSAALLAQSFFSVCKLRNNSAALFSLQQISPRILMKQAGVFFHFIYLISQMQSAVSLLICWLSVILNTTLVRLMLTMYCIVNINSVILKKQLQSDSTRVLNADFEASELQWNRM